MAHRGDFIGIELFMNDGTIVSAVISARVLRNLAWYLKHNMPFPMFLPEGVSLPGESNTGISDIQVVVYKAPS